MLLIYIMKIITIMLFTSLLFSEEKYKEPTYKLIEQKGNIEIREYNQYVIAKTSTKISDNKEDNNMFRTLAGYIFGNNNANKSIPMTAPVTMYDSNNTQTMIFYMLDAKTTYDLPIPDNKDIKLENFNLGKCAVIKFSWFTSDFKINKYKEKLKNYLSDNNLIALSPYMLNRYDPPWRMPFMRRNEIIVQIK